MTRTEHLQQLWDTIRPAQFGAATAELRPFKGWYMIFEIAVSFGEDGSHIGNNWREAEAHIYWLCGKEKAA